MAQSTPLYSPVTLLSGTLTNDTERAVVLDCTKQDKVTLHVRFAPHAPLAFTNILTVMKGIDTSQFDTNNARTIEFGDSGSVTAGNHYSWTTNLTADGCGYLLIVSTNYLRGTGNMTNYVLGYGVKIRAP
jgi:hypothetical protein